MRHKLFTLFLALTGSVGMIHAEQFTIDGVQYYTTGTDPNTVDVYKLVTSRDTVVIPDTITYEGVQYQVTRVNTSAFASRAGVRYISLPNSITTIGEKAFSECTNLTYVVMPDSLVSIGNRTFYNCTSLQGVTLPTKLSAISDEMFRGCNSLEDFVIPEGVTSIGSKAFRECKGLKSILLPSTVNTIASEAIRDCDLLTKVTILATNPPSIGSNVFKYDPLSAIYVPCNTLEAYKGAWLDYSSVIAYIPYEEPIVIAPNEMGYVKVPSSPCEAQQLLAVPYYGYLFEAWSDDVTDNPRAFESTEEITYTPEFMAKRLLLWGSVSVDTILMLTVYDNIEASNVKATLSAEILGATINILDFHTARWGWEVAIEISHGDTTTQHMVHIAKNKKYSYGSVRATITGENKLYAESYNIVKDGNGTLYEDAHVSAYNSAESITDSLGNIGWKLNKNANYLAITLTNETFSAGDILNIYTTRNTNFNGTYYSETDSCLHVYSDAGRTPLVTIPENPQPGLHSVVLGKAANGIKSIYLYRTKNDMNPYVTYMEVLGSFHYTYTVECDPQRGYAVHPEGKTDYLGECAIEVVANYGYHFTQWSDGVTDNPRQVILNSDTTFTAEFTPNEYTITTTSAEPEWGTTGGDTTALYLDSVTISAKANYGYHFVEWTDSPVEYEPTITPNRIISVVDAYTIASGLQNRERTSQKFTVAGYIVGTFASTGYSYYLSDSASDMGNGFVIYRVNTPANIGDFVFVTGYLYNYDGIYETYQGAELSYIAPEFPTTEEPVSNDSTISMTTRSVEVTSDTTYTAHFAKNIYTITKHDDPVMGHIDGISFAEYLDTVKLTAIPNHGYHFVQWSDGLTDNPRTLILTQDTAFTAEFAQTFSGQCGENLYWSFSADTLTLTGEGEMYIYGQYEVPWSLFTDQTRYIDLSQAMTSVSPHAFLGMAGVHKVNLPSTLMTIGAYAFADCSGLHHLTIPNSIKTLGTYAFYGCTNIDTLVIGTGITTITDQFRMCSGLQFLQLSQNIQRIDYGAFFEARRLNYIVCYAKQPPLAYPDEGELLRSFYNTHAAVLIPCDNFDAYKHDALWGSFDLQCQSSTEASASANEVIVVPGDADATFTWPTESSAATYNLEITKNGEVFCTLTFNSQGQLSGIAFAPSRSGNTHHAPKATLSANGMTFKVTGLDYASQYRFSFETKNADAKTVFAYMGAFHTNGTDAPQGIEDIQTNDTEYTKYLINGQIYIIRGEKKYTLTGQEVR